MRWLGWVFVVAVGCAEVPRPDGGVLSACVTGFALSDFGEVQTGKRVSRQLVLRNTTSRALPLTLSAVRAPFSAEGELLGTVDPAASRLLVVTFAPTDALLHVVRLTLDAGPGCPLQELELRGLGSGTVTAPALVDFGAVPIGALAHASMMLTNSRRVGVDVQLFDLERSSPFTFPLSVHLDAQASQVVPLTFFPTGAGPAETSVLITTELGDMTSTTLAAVGGFPDAVFSPSTFHIDHLPEGLAVIRALRIGNGGPGELHLHSARVTQSSPPSAIGELQVVRLPPFISAGSEVNALMQIIAGSPGPRAWVVTFETNQPDRPFVDVTVSGRAEAIGACSNYTLGPTDIAIPVGGTPTTVELRLGNGSSDSCLIDDIHFERADGTLWPFTPSTNQVLLVGGGSITWSVSATTPGSAQLFFTPINLFSTGRMVNIVAPP